MYNRLLVTDLAGNHCARRGGLSSPSDLIFIRRAVLQGLYGGVDALGSVRGTANLFAKSLVTKILMIHLELLIEVEGSNPEY